MSLVWFITHGNQYTALSFILFIIFLQEIQAEKVKSDGSKVPIAYMVLEFVEGGDLFDFVT